MHQLNAISWPGAPLILCSAADSAQNIHALGSNNFWSRSFSAADDTRPRGPKGTQGVGLRKRTWNVWKVAKEMRKHRDCYPHREVQEPKLACEKKQGSYRDLNQHFRRFPWISTDSSAESHGFGWPNQGSCTAATVLLISHYIFREQLCIVSGLQFSFQPTDS